jgi:hypothetical protein
MMDAAGIEDDPINTLLRQQLLGALKQPRGQLHTYYLPDQTILPQKSVHVVTICHTGASRTVYAPSGSWA